MTTGVVLMAYGTPRSPAEIEPYYVDIRRGRPPTPEQLADLVRRYDAIGGTSPLAARTEQQRQVLQTALDERRSGGFLVGLGLKHATPKIEQGVDALVAGGVDRIVGLVLAPHYSSMSIGEYLGRARAAATEAGVPFAGIDSWAREPAYVDFLARAVRARLATMPPATHVAFTAHSLPRRILDDGDPYPTELLATAAAVSERVGLEAGQWSVGWQSAGRTPEPWIGPDVLAVIDAMAAASDVDGLLVCPCGFVADHLEVLYDLDIEARARADAAGLAFARTDSLNADATVLAALADRVVRGERSGVMTRVLVIGGGISGLTTAYELAGIVASDVAIELREASDRLGGKLRTSPFAGLAAVDEGADAFLARVPHATALARATGLGDELTSPTGATAAVWLDGLHPIPEGLLLGVPADMLRLARSPLLSWRGKARAALEPLLPRRDAADSIGRLVRARFGDEVQERLVDALVGSIYATDTDRSSLAMVPQLAALAGRGRSLLLSARAARAAAPATAGPVFYAPRRGMGSLVDAVAAAATSRGVAICLGRPVGSIEADGAGWRADDERFDAVVLATPAAATAPLLAAATPEAARLLATMDHAGVVLVTLAVSDWPEHLQGRSGYLVPKPVQDRVTAASFGSQKWAHWRGGHGEVVRVSLGRDGLPVDDLDDDSVVEQARRELARHVGAEMQPTAHRVSRWPAAFPQYRPHHRDWLQRVGAAMPSGVFVTGASYEGIGVPACIDHAQRTAARVAAHIAP